MQFITLLDYFLLPVYLVIIYFIAFRIRDSQYPVGHPWRPYFIPGLTAKIGGAIGIGLVYQYYYGGGDTANYFWHAKIINSAFSDSIDKWFNLVFHLPEWYEGRYSHYISQMEWYQSPTEYIIAQITALLGVFTFTTFLPTSVLYGAIAYTGVWALFRTFATRYPTMIKYIAIATLFIPSVLMWGSGIFKDTVCLFALGWMTYGAFRLLISRDFRIQVILMTVLSFYLVSSIKIYILMAFLPAIMLWILFTYSHRVGSAMGRFFLKVSVIGLSVVGFMFFSQKFAEELGKYSLEKIAKTSAITSAYIAYVSGDEGSAYSLGAFDPTMTGMLKKFPAAVNVTLFRPYIWETRKVMQMLNAIEATIFLFVTLKVIFSVGLRRAWQTIKDDPTIQFCLIFAIIFAFAVGVSSGNFGTLSRYRIPCLPFYGLALIIIYYKNKPIENNIFALKK